MSYFVYILECANKTLYTGITTDLKRRFNEHLGKKGAHFTKANRPKQICYFEKQPNRSQATKREIEIKSWTKKKKLQLIKGRS
jgi:putative endonuclease